MYFNMGQYLENIAKGKVCNAVHLLCLCWWLGHWSVKPEVWVPALRLNLSYMHISSMTWCQAEGVFCGKQFPLFWLNPRHSAARITKLVSPKGQKEREERDLKQTKENQQKKCPNPTKEIFSTAGAPLTVWDCLTFSQQTYAALHTSMKTWLN